MDDNHIASIRQSSALVQEAPLLSTSKQIRTLKELAPVLYDEKCSLKTDLDSPVYETWRDCGDDNVRDLLAKQGLRYDLTIMPPNTFGDEYVKTLGHYHQPNGTTGSYHEIFGVIEGEAQFLIQKQCGQEVVDVLLLVAKEGEKILIPSNYGHVMINASSKRLVTENLISRSCVQCYDHYVKWRGGAYYVLTGDRYVKNSHYSSVPRLQVTRPASPSFLNNSSSLVQSFMNDPKKFGFLNEPAMCLLWKFAQ